VRAARLDPGQIGMHSRQDAALDVGRVLLPAREQRRSKRTRSGALAGARRAMEQIGVRQLVLALERRRQRHARLRLVPGPRKIGRASCHVVRIR